MRYIGFILALSEFNISPVEGDEKEPKKPAKAQSEKGSVFNIYAVDTNSEKEKKQEFRAGFAKNNVISKITKKLGKNAYTIVFRSPESMVRYLGNLIAAQVYREDCFVPTVFDPLIGREVNLFRVERGSPGREGSSLYVTDHERETFYIPRPAYGALDRDRSMETLSLVADVLNGAVSKKAFPQVNTFTLTAQ